MHGEDRGRHTLLKSHLETPPHAWGRLTPSRGINISSGNTPTCMGKTDGQAMDILTVQKHPHMHGEDVYARPDTQTDAETPPHAWGRQTIIRQPYDDTRNTPTCMGKTRGLKWSTSTRRKHPHMHGEDLCTSRHSSGRLETPPHAWGRPVSASTTQG